MSYWDNYSQRVLRGANSHKERMRNDIRRSFDRYLKTSLTCQEIPISKVEQIPILSEMEKQLVSINDVTNNDQTHLDEKIMSVPFDLDVDVGCYLFWDNCWWLVWFKEHKITNTYKKFVIRRCNHICHYKFKGKIYDIPVSITNLTMYSDGLADVEYLKYLNYKRQVSYGSNPITRTIDVGYRLILTQHYSYRVSHINDFEYNGRYSGSPGLIRALVISTRTLTEDDSVDDIPWNPQSELEIKDIDITNTILGDDYIDIGEKNEYLIKLDGITNVKWTLDSPYYDSVELLNADDEGYVEGNSCMLYAKPKVKYVGYNIGLIAINSDDNSTIGIKTVQIRGV